MTAGGPLRVALGVVSVMCLGSNVIVADSARLIEQAPLHARTGTRGATLFKEMNASAIGIVVKNDFSDPKMWNEHYREFTQGAVGNGVAIADYDGDGLPDVFVVSKTEQCRLFRNLGGWKFEDVTEKTGLAAESSGLFSTIKRWVNFGDDASADTPDRWKQGAVFADVNNDGWLDLYVCRFGAPNYLYINQTDGTFKEEAKARGLDIVDSCGIGAFCDYDRDGWLDVFVTTNVLDASRNPDGQPGYLFHNNRDGTFTNVTAASGIHGELQSHSATWWDYDNDGWPDLHVANDFAGADFLYHNNRDGTFTEVADRVLPAMPYSSMGADLGDVDNDGRPDLLVADMAATSHEKDQRGMAYSRSSGNTVESDGVSVRQSSRNMLYLNAGVGACREAAFLAGLAATDWTWSVRFEDLDNDGRVDLFVTNGMVREFQNADLLNREMRADNPAERIAMMRASAKLREPTLAYRNLGDLQFEEVGSKWGLSRRDVSFGTAFGDLDDDGDLDIVYTNYEGNVSVLRNDSDSGHRVKFALRGTKSNRHGVGARVVIETDSGRQVRELVLARGYLSSSEPVVHFGTGQDKDLTRVTVYWPSGEIQEFGHLPCDREYTITEPDEPVDLKTAPDRGRTGRTLFAETSAPLQSQPPNPREAAADFNHDGQTDRFVGAGAKPDHYPLAGSSALLESRNGRLEDVTDELAPGLRDVGIVSAALWSDVDADGWPDLIVALDWGRVRYFHNNEGRSFEDRTDASGFASAGSGWWRAIESADFNGDGRPDFVVGNVGLNTQYHASPEHPALVFYGDFSGRGKPQVIEAYYEGDKLFPWRTRKELGSMIPMVLRKFPNNDSYARATLEQIVGEDQLAASRRFAVTQLNSGVLMSQPDGRYTFEPLPRIAQIAPIRGIVAGDFDGDGFADIYAVQNERAPLPSVSDFTGGLSQLLRGDGHGKFTPVPPSESGLVVRGDARAVTTVDLDHDGLPDFVVTLDGGQTLAFRNNGVVGHKPPLTAGGGDGRR